MLFNSIHFLLFLPIVFCLYWALQKRSLKTQNLLLLAASYFFYGCWDWRFVSLILFSTIADYLIGLELEKSVKIRRRKALLVTSIVINIGLLGVFKYYNFFLDSLYSLFPSSQTVFGFRTLDVILPVGISFYTFQTLSYTIDIYKKKFQPTNDFIAFAAFVSFFPQLVAGPIERASSFLPQFLTKRKFNYYEATLGMRQILWGLFKKVVIADNCAELANDIFLNYDTYNGSTLFLGAVLFSFQIYGDFSGYSDIAIGTAKLFGFRLMKNFAYPYFSRDIAEFWRRWHISLSTWFRDYLYIPLGGSKVNRVLQIRNVFVVFIVSGFWHGANWTFIFWGLLHAIFFLPLLLLNTNRRNINVVANNNILPSVKDVLKITTTFVLVTFAWIFFRAENMGHAIEYIGNMLTYSLFSVPKLIPYFTIIFIGMLLFVEWLGKENSFALEKVMRKQSIPVRWGFYLFIAFCIFLFQGEAQEFIYFQF